MKLVIFDVDGTLVDSQHHIDRSMRMAFETAGHVCPPREEVLSIVGLSLPQAFARLVPDLPEAEHLRLIEGYKSSFGTLVADGPAPLYPGAMDCLQALIARDDILLGVATGKSRRGLRIVLDGHGIAGHFITRQTADDHPSKPHPAMVQAACDEAGVDPRDAVMIGDTTFDIEMGRAAGAAALGVGWGYHPAAALRAAGAGAVVAGFDAVPAAIDALLAGRPVAEQA
ncbi:HAD-IA family hydrolase [Frigidibacter sp. MR17.24]|uniref:HAD-IA family hydrolase n=1 Tax=Frigidibacter sp. MR17.24 TaxID=3127345 RepID=UPI003012B920